MGGGGYEFFFGKFYFILISCLYYFNKKNVKVEALDHPHQWMQTIHLFCTKNLLFLFYTLFFTKHPYQSIYFTHLFNKIFIFLHYHLSHRPNTTQQTTIINPPNLPASIINPLNHHHQATSLHHQPTQIPIQPNHLHRNPNAHSTQLPSMKSKYSSNPVSV